jgi:hypothetical protein
MEKSMNKRKRKKIRVLIDCDTERLYGDLKAAAAYLLEIAEEHPTATLHEEWSGYEDMGMVFQDYRDETDEELALRLKMEEERRRREDRDREVARQREQRLKQYQKLKREFG